MITRNKDSVIIDTKKNKSYIIEELDVNLSEFSFMAKNTHCSP